MEIIHENEYVYKMNDEIEPYLATHRQEGYIPGAEDHLHRKDMGIVGKIHVQRYLAEKPKGVIIIAPPIECAKRTNGSSGYVFLITWHIFKKSLTYRFQVSICTRDESAVRR